MYSGAHQNPYINTIGGGITIGNNFIKHNVYAMAVTLLQVYSTQVQQQLGKLVPSSYIPSEECLAATLNWNIYFFW